MVERREKIRQRFARLGLFVFIALSLCRETLRAETNARDEAVGRFAGPPGEGVRRPPFEG